MKLIADSGSTKTEWCLVRDKGKKYFETEGYNPYFVTREYIVASLSKSLPEYCVCDQVTDINFYGAGCMLDKRIILQEALQNIFRMAKVNVEEDLLGAARALLGKSPGFAAILGTGCNTCMYDGEKVTMNIDSLGYMLGDEGSGSYIGKKLLQDYLRGYMPEDIHRRFSEKINLSFDEIMDQIYIKPLSNRFCAEFTKFANENVDNAYVYGMVKNAFTEFFRNLVVHYPDYQKYCFNCTGSVGYFFKNILTEVAIDFGMKVGAIVRYPLGSLIKYHLS